ncbi:hypothetical protein EJB05_02017, partial [Eragrostis curvula]
MFLLDWFYGLLALLGLRRKVEQPPISRTVIWQDLTPELLNLVFLRLPTRADRARFPAVCRQWLSSIQKCQQPPLSPMPWIVHPGGNIIRFPHGKIFHLPENTCYHNSCGQWLLLSRNDDSCFLMNPFTKATVPLPSLSSYITYDEHVEIVNDHIIPDHEMDTWMDIKDLNDVSVITLIVCSTNLIAAIVAICGLGTIALCRPGASAWSVSAHDRNRWLSDMVFFQGKLYTVDARTGDLFSVDIVDGLDNDVPRMCRIERIIEGAPIPPRSLLNQTIYLLESHGTILMVCRTMSSKVYTVCMSGSIDNRMSHPAGSSEFNVFVADLKLFFWADVSSLGNEVALFIGRGCSTAVRVSPHDLSRDCIFFLDDYIEHSLNKTTTHCGLYDMKDGKIYSPLWMVSWKSGSVPATWLFSPGKKDELQTGEHLQELEPGDENPVARLRMGRRAHLKPCGQ